MSPTPRLSDFLRKINQSRSPSGDQRQTRITQEVIDQIRPDGQIVVRGYILPPSGVKIDFKVGEIVSVAWNKDGVPQLAFAHNWRRSEFPEGPEEIDTTALEIVFIGSVGGENGVFIVNDTTVVALDFRDKPVGSLLDVSWGLNQNTILVRFKATESPFKETLRAVKIDRPLIGDGARNLPAKRDPTTGDLEELGESGVPFLKTADLSEKLVIDNVPLGRNFVIKEKFNFRSAASIGLEERFTFPLPTPAPIFFQGVESADLKEFEQTTPINLDIAENPNLIQNAYVITLEEAYLNESNQIICIYTITWNVGNLWDQSFEESEDIGLCGDVTGPNIKRVGFNIAKTEPFDFSVINAGVDVPFASPTFPGQFGCANIAFRGTLGCSVPPCGPPPAGALFNRISHDKVGETQWGQFSEVPYAFLNAHPQESFEFPDIGQFFDMFVLNRETEQIIGATFTEPTWEYEREMVYYLGAAAERRHTDTDPPSVFSFDELFLRLPFIDGTFSLRTGPGSFGAITSFVGTGRYHPEVNAITGDLEFGSGVLDVNFLNTFAPDTIKNFRVTGRGFHDLRDEEPFDEVITARTIFLRSSADGSVPGPNPSEPFFLFVSAAGNSFLLDVVERTRKKPEAEIRFSITSGRPVVTLGNKVVFEARREVDPDASPGLDEISVHEWTIGTPGGLVQIFDTREELSLAVIMQSHEQGILADWSDPLVQFFLRKDGAVHLTEGVPDNLIFSLPNSYSNEVPKDRRIYTLKINDENVAVFKKSGSPPLDLIDAIEGAVVSGTPAYHVVQVTTEVTP